MRLLLCSLSIFCLLVVISAKEALEANVDPIEAESKEHSSKKYSKDNQKVHHHGHKHKKHAVQGDQPLEADLKPKAAPLGVPEPEIQLQSNIETSKKAIEEQKQKERTEDLHLQDLTHEENLKKDKKKKKNHHGAHQAEILEKPKRKNEKKLFADQEGQVEEKVIEDSFAPLKEANPDGERKNKGNNKKSKDKSRNKKKASEKNKDKSKKQKDGKKKNKDKKNKNKDKKKW